MPALVQGADRWLWSRKEAEKALHWLCSNHGHLAPKARIKPRAKQATASHQHTDCKGPVCQKMSRLQQNSNLGQLFRPCWELSARCRVMPEPDENCSFVTKWTVSHLWAKFTNDLSTGCAAIMATRHHKQGSSPCLYVRLRQAIASNQHTDCKGPMFQKKRTRLLAKLEPRTAVSALLGLISKVQSYAGA